MHKKLTLTLTLGALALAACTEDLGPITKTWTELATSFSTQIAELTKTLAELKGKAAGLAAPGADDKEGTDLKGKLDAALAGFEKGLTDAQGLVATGTTSVNDALLKGKVAGVQTAMDKVKGDVTGALDKLKPQTGVIQGLIGDLEKHAAAMAEKAKAAANAAAGEAPPTIDATKGGEADYGSLDFKEGTDQLALDKPATKANLDAMVALMNSCADITVEVEGHTSKVGDAKKNKDLSAKRAQSVTRHLINVGKVSPSKIKKTYGYGSEKPAMDEPEPGSDAEKAMDAAKLAQVRDRNERIHLRILKPCPAGK